jgi:hypothetical protein
MYSRAAESRRFGPALPIVLKFAQCGRVFSVKISGLDEVLAIKLVLVREQFGDFEAAEPYRFPFRARACQGDATPH